MKAAVYYETGPPSVFKYEDVPDPACPPGGLRIAVEPIGTAGGDPLSPVAGARARGRRT